ncbi:MAG: hypothetical protein Q7U89_00580 [Coriobacteriia bacterium]|nr:hypothetical protein [Coriobacteriia bacterium]
MKNSPIRFKILLGVVLINILGAAAVVVYLHQSYSSGLDDAAFKEIVQSQAAWNNIQELGTAKLSANPSFLEKSPDWLDRMKAQTGMDYFLLLDKTVVDQAAYVSAREKANLGNNWDEQDQYVVALSTSDALYDAAIFDIPAADVPETGKLTGVENGSCTKTCHGNLGVKDGEYWAIAWSDNELTNAHGVSPVIDAEGRAIGVLYSIENITDPANAAKDSMLLTLVVIGVTLLVATLVIGGLLDTLVFKRLSRMIASMEDISMRVAGGDFDAHFEARGPKDEIGKFEEFFGQFMSLVSMTFKSLMK